MLRKTVCLCICAVALFALSADLYAGSFVRWAGNYAGTSARTYVPGATVGSPICVQNNGGAPPPAISSLCYAARTTPDFAGAWAFAYANIVTGRRVTISASGTWGSNTFAGKALGDTTRCSTYVEIIPAGEFIDLQLYSYLESPLESNRLASCDISVTADGETLFSGGIKFHGDEANTAVEGEFNTAPIVYGEGSATIDFLFPGINLGGHDPDRVEILVTTDAMRHDSIPSVSVYGAVALILLLVATGIYIYLRRRLSHAA